MNAYVPREIEFKSGELTLKGYLFVPSDDGPHPCVINNHSSSLRPGGSQVSRPQLAALMMAWGYAFFFPHRRGYGNSPGETVASAIPAPLGSTEYDAQISRRLDEECEDVLAAITAMRAGDLLFLAVHFTYNFRLLSGREPSRMLSVFDDCDAKN